MKPSLSCVLGTIFFISCGANGTFTTHGALQETRSAEMIEDSQDLPDASRYLTFERAMRIARRASSWETTALAMQAAAIAIAEPGRNAF